jgi:hypothetical protein
MKVKKGKAGSGVNAGCSIMEDVRFVGAGTDPRFQNVPKAKKKARALVPHRGTPICGLTVGWCGLMVGCR